MNIPFSEEQFFAVFAAYNDAFWPVAVLCASAAIVTVAFALLGKKLPKRWTSGLLAFMWLLMGAAYHWGYFSPINKAAYLFGSLFIVQGLLFLILFAKGADLTPVFRRVPRGWVGLALIGYALAVYPALGLAFGHGLGAGPLFGIAPCPTTIFTFGLLLLAETRIPAYLYVVPALWSFIGFFAALKLGVPEDFGLPAAAILGLIFLPGSRSKVRLPRSAALVLVPAALSLLPADAGADTLDPARLDFYRDGNSAAAMNKLAYQRPVLSAEPEEFRLVLGLAELALLEGEILEAAGDRRGADRCFSEALEFSRRAVDLDGRSSPAFRALADAAMRVLPYRSMLYKATKGFAPKDYAQKAIDLDGQNGEAYLSLGLYYLFCPRAFGGDPAKAAEAVRAYLAMGTDDIARFRGSLWLARALSESGKRDEAKASLDAAAAIFPESPWLLQERKTLEGQQ